MARELAKGDREMYFRYMRMTPDRMEHLLSMVAPYITNYQLIMHSPFPLISSFRSLCAILLQEDLKFPLVCNTALDDNQFQK